MLQRPVGTNSRTIETTNGDRTHRHTDRQTFANGCTYLQYLQSPQSVVYLDGVSRREAGGWAFARHASREGRSDDSPRRRLIMLSTNRALGGRAQSPFLRKFRYAESFPPDMAAAISTIIAPLGGSTIRR